MKPLRLALLSALVALAASCADAPAPEPARRVFLIGVDGATWTRLDPLLTTGRLKALATLLNEGVRAPLESMLPTVSPALWTTVATGKSFEKHGINDFTVEAGEDGEKSANIMHMTSNMRRTKALWNILGDVGKRSAFIGWWVTWPAEEVRGYQVSSHIPLDQQGGRAEPTKGTLQADLGRQTWPPELFDEVAPLILPADSVTYEDAKRFMQLEPEEIDRDIVEGFKWAYSADETYRAVANLLLEKDPDVELWGIYFNGVDVVEHRYWKYNEPAAYRPFDPEEIPRFRNVIDRYYQYTDDLIWEILQQRRPGDTFFLISDHGFHARGHKDAPPGIFVAAGEHIDPAAQFTQPPRLLDVAPTALALLGIPAAEDMDGRILDELFTPEWRRTYPRDRIDTYDTEEWSPQAPIASDVDEELLKRLRTLGYIE
jgi:predicted AlkP superfamily phosphohydrolase/phosphomutase